MEMSLHLFQLGAAFILLRKGELVLTQLRKIVSYRKQVILHGGCMLFWGLSA